MSIMVMILGETFVNTTLQWGLLGHSVLSGVRSQLVGRFGSTQLILALIDRKGPLFAYSAWWLASFVGASLLGSYSVIEGKGLFGHSVLVTRFVRRHLFGHRSQRNVCT